ncbi:hypothetical protein [Azospirillum halopraeferens]|uniref:hypothetical protein n=1 Tax=Azospirillum halopraeferens TaxID=34010 RepID=UPI0003F8EE8E|nr:hypothetical protein [Azospirillum halopraeferens]
MGTLENLAPVWRDAITQLEVTDAITGGPDGNDNRPHRELAERTLYLRDRQDALAAAVQDHAGRVALLETSGTTAVADALRISWALSDRGFDFELFVAGHSWRDLAPVGGAATVAGDDSVDVASTAGVMPGQTYVIHEGGTTRAVITVAQVLSATRLRATAPIGVTLTGATLSRTSWTVGTGAATAGHGGVLLSRPLSALRYTSDGRVVIRRDGGDGTLSVAWRRSGEPAWTEGRLLDTSQREPGTRDEEWAIGGGDAVELRVTAAHGPGAGDIGVHFLVALTAPEAGVATAVRRPAVIDPANGDVEIGETPTLTGAAYLSLYGLPQGAAEFRVALDEGMQSLVHAAVTGAATAYAVPAGPLQTGRTYWWSCRYADIEGTWSPWSEPAGFATASTFIYIQKPSAISPASGATGVSLTPTLQSSAFAVHGGTDVHVSSRWRIYADAACTNMVHSHVPAMALTSYTVPAGVLAADTPYWWTVEHQGQALGWTQPSLAAALRTQSLPAAPTLLAPTEGATGVALSPTLQSSGFFVAGGGTDVHVASRWRVSLPDGTLVHDSGDTAALTSYTVPAGVLSPLTAYRAECRHRGQALGWGPWSAAVTYTTAAPSGSQVFTSSGVFTVPAGVTNLKRVRVIGPGGRAYNDTWNGGGGGGYARRSNIAVTSGEQIPVTVAMGQTTSFGTYVSATPGADSSAGGEYPAKTWQPGGIGAGGDVTATGGQGTPWEYAWGGSCEGCGGGRGGEDAQGNPVSGGTQAVPASGPKPTSGGARGGLAVHDEGPNGGMGGWSAHHSGWSYGGGAVRGGPAGIGICIVEW